MEKITRKEKEMVAKLPKRKSAKRLDSVYQLRITLIGSQPPIWRRILVSGRVNLGRLDRVLQSAMGWENCHLYMFIVGNKKYSDPDPEWDVEDEWRVRLCDIAPKVKDEFVYAYDIGDGWQHDVVVEDILGSDVQYNGFPVCLAGANACPPEDCGGIGGYGSFLEAIFDPEHEEHERMLEWNGGTIFDPNLFELEKINRELRRAK